MKIHKFILFIILVLIFINSNVVNAKNLRAVTGLALPPYIISDDNTGMEMEIVREALKLEGHTFTMKYIPFIRIRKTMETKEADMAFPLNEASGVTDVYYSKSHITYQNVVVSLKYSGFNINEISDLKNQSIVAFQDATLYLGEEYKNTVINNPNYKEMSKQEAQVALLFAKRTDLIVIDINIFAYFKKSVKKANTNQEVVIHRLFPETHYKVAFTDKNIRDQFDRGVEELKKSGRYDEIINKYIEK